MSTRDPDQDDWFAEAERSQQRRDELGPDDWINTGGEAPPRRPAGPNRWEALPRAQQLGLAGIALLLLLVIALAAAGVFSGSSNPAAQATTDTVQVTTTPAVTTTALIPPLPTTTLKPGDTGLQVRRLQRALVALGHSPGKIDGDYGPATEAAVVAFQKENGLTADGIVGPKTLAAIRSQVGP